jgi:thiol-disulfide isomerase/thioredoxin
MSSSWELVILALVALSLVGGWVIGLQRTVIRRRLIMPPDPARQTGIGPLSRPTIVVFLSDSCGLCEDLARGLAAASDQTSSHEFRAVVLGDAADFAARTGLGVPQLAADAQSLSQEYGVDGTPYAVAFDASGHIQVDAPVFSYDDVIELARAAASQQPVPTPRLSGEPAASSSDWLAPAVVAVKRALGNGPTQALADAEVARLRVEALGTEHVVDQATAGRRGLGTELAVGIEAADFVSFWHAEHCDAAMTLRGALRVEGSTRAFLALLRSRGAVAAHLDFSLADTKDRAGSPRIGECASSEPARALPAAAAQALSDDAADRPALCTALLLSVAPACRPSHVGALVSDLRNGITLSSDLAQVVDRLAAVAAHQLASTSLVPMSPINEEEQHGAVHR